MTLAGSVPHAAAVVLLLAATVCRLPRAVALSPEEAAGLQGMCDLNPGATGTARLICDALDTGQDPCDVSGVGCTDGHLTQL
eukprot:SAG22_NODE_80_length_21788_cov_9.742542_10_plen_82_part_00